MVKLLTVICLCIGLSIVSSQCSNTALLRTLYGFSNSVTSPTNTSGLLYCESLINAPVCCTASDINSLQTKQNNLANNLSSIVATRDQAYKTIATNTLGQLTAAIQSFNTTLNSFAIYAAKNSSDAETSATNQEILLELEGLQEGADLYLSTYTAATSDVKIDLTTYQKARTTCVVRVMQLQDAAWCLSCNPNAASNGYDPTDGSINLGPDTCTDLKAACYPFISNTLFQGAPLAVLDLIGELQKYAQLATKAQSGQAVSINDFNYVSTVPPSSSVPDDCPSQANCTFACDNLFVDGLINVNDLLAGGDTGDDGGRRLKNRNLDNGNFDPSPNEAGTTVTFPNDPGNTNSATSAKSGVVSFGSVLISAIVLLSSYLL